jgi:hypothetical protein
MSPYATGSYPQIGRRARESRFPIEILRDYRAILSRLRAELFVADVLRVDHSVRRR